MYDLHIWSLTSGTTALTVHLEVAADVNRDVVLRKAQCLLCDAFSIHHNTIQIAGANVVEHCKLEY